MSTTATQIARETTFDWSTSLVSDRPSVRPDMPFALWEFPAFLDDEAYAALERDYPGPDVNWTEATDGLDTKVDISSAGDEFRRVVNRSEAWSSFVDHVETERFRADVVDFCWPDLVDYRRRGLITNHRLRDVVDGAEDRVSGVRTLADELRPEMHFSIMRPRDQNTPHTDGVRKVIALLFYLPTPDWRPEYGGKTLFYRVPEGFERRPWFNPAGNRIPPARLNGFLQESAVGHAADYAPNSLAMFIRATISYHAVSTVRSPEGTARRTFLYTLKFPG